MSDLHDSHDDVHTGPIQTPKQMLWVSIAAFVVPVFVIIGLVYFVSTQFKPAVGVNDQAPVNIAGTTAQERAKGVQARIGKVGKVEVRDAARPAATGEAVYKAQCVACHANGPGPKLGDTGLWAGRIKTGYEALLSSALKGKGGMGAQAGGDYSDYEIARAVVFMANSAGARFAEPTAPAGPAPNAGTATEDEAAKKAAAQVAVAGVGALATQPADANKAVAGGAGEVLYQKSCQMCHAAGVGGAPKTGDKAAWAPRAAQGVDVLTAHVINGKGAMPPRGGSTASDAEIKAAVQYLVSTAK